MPRAKLLISGGSLLALACIHLTALGADPHHHSEAHSQADGTTPGEHDEHAAHRLMMTSPGLSVEQHEYVVPDTDLFNEVGERVNLRDLLASDKPLAVNFIFTTCTTICPVMTATWLQLQQQLIDEPIKPTFVSISIDPSYDTADVLSEYAERFGADWTFLTGAGEDIADVLTAFDASRGSKVNHFPLTLMRPTNEIAWTRVEGLSSARDLAGIWKNLNSQ